MPNAEYQTQNQTWECASNCQTVFQRSADLQIGAIMPGFSKAPIWKSALQEGARSGAIPFESGSPNRTPNVTRALQNTRARFT